METTEEKKPKKKAPMIILSLIIISAAAFGITKYMYSLHHEDTDDAQLDADISPVLSRVSGYVNDIRFEENQHVSKGDTLVRLDDRDLQIKVQQAQSALDNATANVSVAKANSGTSLANVATATSNVEAAKVRVWKATQDFDRYQNLLNDKAITQQQFDAAKAEKLSAEANLESINKQQSAASMQGQAASQLITVAESVIAQRQADLDFAKLQLSYAMIIAPVSGLASRKSIQNGQFINAGTPLFSIVSDEGVYVIANFKETQLEKMKTGLPVKVTVDAFPSEKIDGTIYSLSAATGAKFSLLPPDNATGNYVKVIQRIPVKIKLTGSKELMAMLRPGMSVRVSVRLD
ncbi:MAG: HlyD family secretion protein [Bacteroidetes bacterium]|nr:HlyD family secretion protein [Bacteroidota bacterium]